MASIRIRVGAVLDPGATAVFAPLVAAAQRARKQIAQSGKEAAAEYVGAYRTAPAHAKKSFDDTAKAAETADKRIAASGKRASDERVRSAEHEGRSIQRLLHKQEAERKRIISSAGRTFGGVVRSGLGLAGEVARGAGVDMGVGSLVQRNVATQKTATDISASAYVEGAKGSVGVRKDPKAVIASVKEAADAAALSEEVALAGLQKFVGKSTDLQTGMELIKQMAIQSKATGSNLEDVMDAAGDIAVKLEDTPDKAKILAGVMATVAKQGQLGASELRTMAPYIGRIVSSSNQFASGTEKAVQELGAAFQITKKLQGQTPASAATSVSRFVQDMTSKSGLKSLHGMGIKDSDIFADKGKTKLKNLSEIIPTLLEKSGGDLTKIAKTLPNVKSGSVLKAFAQIYSEAEKTGGKGAGSKAVKATFSEYGGAMSEKQIQESLALALTTTESKAQLFQNRLQAIADQNLPSVIASLEKLAPVAASAAEAFAKVVSFAAENPGKAVAVALAASVAKAALGSVLEAGLARALAGAGASGGLAIGTAAIAITAATLILSAASAAKDEGLKKNKEELATGAALIQKAKEEYATKGALSPETMTALQAEKGRLEEQQGKEKGKTSWVDALVAAIPGTEGTFTGKWKQMGEEQGARRGAMDTSMEKKDINSLLDAGNKHLTAAQALGDSAVALKASAAALANLLPAGGASPGATTGPVPLRQ